MFLFCRIEYEQWYISIVPKGQNLDTHEDTHVYTVSDTCDKHENPPKKWRTKPYLKGIDPPPTCIWKLFSSVEEKKD